MNIAFNTIVIKDKDINATGIEVPSEIVAELGKGKKPAVKITINEYTYRTTVAVMGGIFMIPLSLENREKARVQAGETIKVLIEIDSEPRLVIVPEDLAIALSNKILAFEKLSYSTRKEYVRQIESAKTEETRKRRIITVAEKLLD